MTLKKLLALGTLALGALLPSASTAQEKAAPVVRLSDLQVDPARLAAFRAATVRHAETTSRREPGVLVLHTVADKGNPTHIRVLEVFADAAARDAHLRSAHCQAFLAETGPMTTAHAAFDAVPVFLGAKPALPPNPVVRTADLDIDPAQLDAYKAAVSEEIAASIRLEPGVGAIYAVAPKDTPHRLRFIEIYADENAYLLHRETPHFQKYLAVSQPMITGRKLVEAVAVTLATPAR